MDFTPISSEPHGLFNTPKSASVKRIIFFSSDIMAAKRHFAVDRSCASIYIGIEPKTKLEFNSENFAMRARTPYIMDRLSIAVIIGKWAIIIGIGFRNWIDSIEDFLYAPYDSAWLQPLLKQRKTHVEFFFEQWADGVVVIGPKKLCTCGYANRRDELQLLCAVNDWFLDGGRARPPQHSFFGVSQSADGCTQGHFLLIYSS